MDTLGSPAPQDLREPPEKTGGQERRARKAASAKWAPQDLREARETPVSWVLLERTAWQEPPDQQDHRDYPGPPGPPGLQDHDFPQGLMTWKAPGDPSGCQPEALTGYRERPASLDPRGILE